MTARTDKVQEDIRFIADDPAIGVGRWNSIQWLDPRADAPRVGW